MKGPTMALKGKALREWQRDLDRRAVAAMKGRVIYPAVRFETDENGKQTVLSLGPAKRIDLKGNDNGR